MAARCGSGIAAVVVMLGFARLPLQPGVLSLAMRLVGYLVVYAAAWLALPGGMAAARETLRWFRENVATAKRTPSAMADVDDAAVTPPTVRP